MSKVEVNQVTQQCGTTLTVGGGACKTAVVDATTVTLGRCGGTVSLASGATQSGFGREGSVDWETTIQTSTPFTAATGKGYFINTTAGAITMNLPTSPAVGDIVAFKDYAGTFDTYNLTIGRGGSNIVGGIIDPVISVAGQAVVLVYGDATQGWQSVEAATNADLPRPSFICASVSGACNTLATAPDCANTKIATFVGPGTFTVNSVGSCAANDEISYMLVAGGGGGAGFTPASPAGGTGGGGAGGFRETKSPVTPYTASPKCGYGTPANRITVTATGFPIVVGGGGDQGPRANGAAGGSGGVSSGFGLTAAGGGGGSNFPGAGAPGASGGGGRGSAGGCGGTGNTPPTTPPQGSDGGDGGATGTGGGGGGAVTAGTNAVAAGCTTQGGPGGDGATTSISATPTGYAGGGGGSTGPAPSNNPGGIGTSGGGTGGGSPGCAGTTGTVNTGGGGGGNESSGTCETGNNGGSGIVIIRYKFQ